MKHLIFYFSGTGNSLHAAKMIGKALKPCVVQSMTSLSKPQLEGTYESIGFIYPTYFQGIPQAVETFVKELDFSNCKCEYIYGITTCGELQGNALPQLDKLLQQKGQRLSYSSKLKMFSNYVVMYDLSKKVTQKTENADRALERIIKDLSMKKQKGTRFSIPLLDSYYRWQINRARTSDKHYQVSDVCISCNLCQKVCPVNNIEMKEGKPSFQNQCEQCMACLQYCPQKAINYKEKTQDRRRYHHPEIPSKVLIRQNRKSEQIQ